MSTSDEEETIVSALFAQIQRRLESGEADRVFESHEQPVTERLAKFQKAEELDPQTLKLTVTI